MSSTVQLKSNGLATQATHVLDVKRVALEPAAPAAIAIPWFDTIKQTSRLAIIPQQRIRLLTKRAMPRPCPIESCRKPDCRRTGRSRKNGGNTALDTLRRMDQNAAAGLDVAASAQSHQRRRSWLFAARADRSMGGVAVRAAALLCAR
jgi:hypothetical protein